jgi:hypothetical protein
MVKIPISEECRRKASQAERNATDRPWSRREAYLSQNLGLVSNITLRIGRRYRIVTNVETPCSIQPAKGQSEDCAMTDWSKYAPAADPTNDDAEFQRGLGQLPAPQPQSGPQLSDDEEFQRAIGQSGVSTGPGRPIGPNIPRRPPMIIQEARGNLSPMNVAGPPAQAAHKALSSQCSECRMRSWPMR